MKISSQRIVEALVLVFMFYAANTRGLVIRGFFPVEGAWLEVVIELVVLVIALLLLFISDQLEAYKRVWLMNWPLIVFIGIAVASLIWTIDVSATFPRVLILILSSMQAAYLAVHYNREDIPKLFAGFFAVLVLFCFLVVIIWPEAGVMNNYPYSGSWRGIFWHRNYLGSTMALGTLLFLVCFFLNFAKHKKLAIFYGFFYVLAFVLVGLSRSATGLILVLVLHIILAGVILWLKIYPKMRPLHYGVLGGFLALALMAGYFKLNYLLGFLNRDSNFTGRTGLWSYLLTHYINQRPLLGFGFGAFWQQASIDLQLRDALGWQYAIVIGDNGYMDILLHLGFVGLFVFVVVLILACMRLAKPAFQERTLLAFVPLLVMSYILITNITLSYFLETESFTWIIMIAMWFAATPVETRVDH